MASFNDDWLSSSKFPEYSKWISKKNSATAYCKLCRKEISLSNMGSKALHSHSKSLKHVVIIKETEKHSNISTFYENCATESHLKATDATPKAVTITTSFKCDEATTKAEIIWCFKVATSHYSFRSCADLSSILYTMFPDSAIAQQMSLGIDKVFYFIKFGLYPVLHNALVSKVRCAEFFMISFDESMNDVIQQQQMDIHVRFWDNEKNIAVTRYLTTLCLGYTLHLIYYKSSKKAHVNYQCQK